MMVLCILIILSAVLATVAGECVPQYNPPIKRTQEVSLGGSFTKYAYFKGACDNSQSFIYRKCDAKGDNCKKMYTYSLGNDSISDVGTGYSRISIYQEETYHRIYIQNIDITLEGILKYYITSSGNGQELEGDNTNVTIIRRPNTRDVRITPFREDVPANKKFNLTCLVDMIRPAYRFLLDINGFEFRHGIQIDTPNEHTWNISYTMELVLSPIYPLKVRCIIEKHNGYKWVFSNYFVINPVQDNSYYSGPSAEIRLGCIIPMAFSYTGWNKNGAPFSKPQMSTEVRSEVKGFFDFINPNETSAQHSELRLVLPSVDEGCDAIDEYTGTYTCGAVNTELGFSYTTKPQHVVASYSPILESTQTRRSNILATRTEASIILACPLCSYPPVEEYKWSKGNIEVGHGRTLLVPYVTETDFGEYSCIASNTVGSTNATFNVHKKVDTKANFYQADIDEEVAIECPLCDGNEDECNWQVNDKQVHEGRFYNIDTLTETDYGEYLCIAVFASGRTWMRIRLAKPGTTALEGTDVKVSTNGSTSLNSTENMVLAHNQEFLVFTTEVIAGFAAAGAVVVGMIVTIIVLCCILLRRRTPKEKVEHDVSNQRATAGQEDAQYYEKINPAYKH